MKTFKTCLVAIAILTSIAANAQDTPITFGVKAGMNLSNFSGDIDDSKAKVGFNVGITADYALSPELYILTGLEFTMKGAKSEYEKALLGTKVSYKRTSNPMYLQLPVHLGYKINVAENTKIVLHAGPYVAYGIAGKEKIKASASNGMEGIELEAGDTDFFGKNAAKRFDFGLGLGVGAEFGKIGVGLGYDFGITNIANKNSDVKIRNMNAYLTVGYKF